MATAYILHFAEPYWTTARHYAGSATDFPLRLARHLSGHGSLLVAYALRRGGRFEVGYRKDFSERWQARQHERALKRSGHLARYCTICRQGGAP